MSKVIGLLVVCGLAIGCYGHDEKRVADTNTNWLDCETNDDCDEGLTCVAGVCDESEAVPQPIRVSLDFAGEPIALQDEGDAHRPLVRFTGDRWSVAWLTQRQTLIENAPDAPLRTPYHVLRVHEVERSGALGSSHSSSFEASFQVRQMLIGMSPAGEAVVWNQPNSWRFGELCKMTILRWETGASTNVDLPCATPAAVAYLAASDDWLVAAHDGADALLGVYAFEREWIAPLTLLGAARGSDTSSLPPSFALSSAGGAASVLWINGDNREGVRIADVSDPTVRSPFERLGDVLHHDARYWVAQLNDRAVAIGVRDSKLWSSVLREGKAEDALQIGSGASDEDRLSIAVNTQRELLAVCYWSVEGSEQAVAMVVLDYEGRAVSDPLMLSDSGQNSAACDLAWSDDALLAAWIDAPLDEGGVPFYRAISARRIAVTR